MERQGGIVDVYIGWIYGGRHGRKWSSEISFGER